MENFDTMSISEMKAFIDACQETYFQRCATQIVNRLQELQFDLRELRTVHDDETIMSVFRSVDNLGRLFEIVIAKVFNGVISNEQFSYDVILPNGDFAECKAAFNAWRNSTSNGRPNAIQKKDEEKTKTHLTTTVSEIFDNHGSQRNPKISNLFSLHVYANHFVLLNVPHEKLDDVFQLVKKQEKGSHGWKFEVKEEHRMNYSAFKKAKKNESRA